MLVPSPTSELSQFESGCIVGWLGKALVTVGAFGSQVSERRWLERTMAKA